MVSLGQTALFVMREKEIRGSVCFAVVVVAVFGGVGEKRENLCMTRGGKLVVWKSCDIIYLVGGCALGWGPGLNQGGGCALVLLCLSTSCSSLFFSFFFFFPPLLGLLQSYIHITMVT